jgi:hypothetical protein
MPMSTAFRPISIAVAGCVHLWSSTHSWAADFACGYHTERTIAALQADVEQPFSAPSADRLAAGKLKIRVMCARSYPSVMLTSGEARGRVNVTDAAKKLEGVLSATALEIERAIGSCFASAKREVTPEETNLTGQFEGDRILVTCVGQEGKKGQPAIIIVLRKD